MHQQASHVNRTCFATKFLFYRRRRRTNCFRSSHTHLAALRPPQSPRTALYRPRHPPTRWHLHRVTSITATLFVACMLAHTRTHTLSCRNIPYVTSRKMLTHKLVYKNTAVGSVCDESGLMQLYAQTPEKDSNVQAAHPNGTRSTSWTQPESVQLSLFHSNLSCP